LPLTNEEIVYQYFKLMESKDLYGMLDLFDHNAIIYEPFSKVKGLQGKSAIEPFLKVAMMANSNLKRFITIDKGSSRANKIVANVTFEKGAKVDGRFTFEFVREDRPEETSKIKILRIAF
jgi:hypothetical protein